MAEFSWLKKEIEKEAGQLAQPMARQLASMMSEARLSEEKARHKKEAEELVVSTGFRLLNILAVVIRAVKDAADKVGDENQIYFTSSIPGPSGEFISRWGSMTQEKTLRCMALTCQPVKRWKL